MSYLLILANRIEISSTTGKDRSVGCDYGYVALLKKYCNTVKFNLNYNGTTI